MTPTKIERIGITDILLNTEFYVPLLVSAPTAVMRAGCNPSLISAIFSNLIPSSDCHSTM